MKGVNQVGWRKESVVNWKLKLNGFFFFKFIFIVFLLVLFCYVDLVKLCIFFVV